MENNILLARLKPEIDSIDEAMRRDLQELAANNLITPGLAEVLQHALFNGGKRFRPLLCVLAAGLCGRRGEDVYRLAIAFEYLHVATLLHDDVIDHAETRRGRPPVSCLFGLAPAILAGDFLHARSMFLVGTIGGRECLEILCRATEAMVAGEFLQLANTENFNQQEDDYFAVINGKTALFIGAVCECGAIFSRADEEEREALQTYGSCLGRAFQIQDDLLDYLGDPVRTGKVVGNDFCEGKMTLPLIHALNNCNSQEKKFLLDLLMGEKEQRCDWLGEARDIIGAANGFDYSRRVAQQLTATAIGSLDIFSDRGNEEIVASLAGLAAYVLRRDK